MLVSGTRQHIVPGGVEGEPGNRTVVDAEGVTASLALDVPDTEALVGGRGDEDLLVTVRNYTCYLLRVTLRDDHY